MLAAGSRSPGDAAEADDPVDDQVGAGEQGARGAGLRLPAARGQQRGQPPLVHHPAEPDGLHPCPPARQPGPRPQRVAPVVAGPDEQHHP